MHKSAALIKEPPADQAVRARASEQAAAAAREAVQRPAQPQTPTQLAREPQKVAEALQARNKG